MLNNDIIKAVSEKFGVQGAIQYLETQIFILELVQKKGMWLTYNDGYNLYFYKEKLNELKRIPTINAY